MSEVTPISGDAAATISRILGRAGVESYSVQNCEDYVAVISRVTMQVVNALDAQGYQYSAGYSPNLEATVFKVTAKLRP